MIRSHQFAGSLCLAVLSASLAFVDSAFADDMDESAAVTVHVVDEAGNAVADAIVECRNWQSESAEAVTDGDGRASLNIPDGGDRLLVRSAEGSELGYKYFGGQGENGDIEITLKPARVLDLSALFEGQPVLGATVEVHVSYRPIAVGTTDDEGRCNLAIPQDAIIQTIMIFRSGVGFAGFTRGNEYYSLTSDDSPDEYQFELTAATRIAVRVEDRQHRPVEGVTVYPWLIQMPGEAETLNMGAAGNMTSTTNDRGEAVFDFFPENAEYIAFGVKADEDFHTLSNAYWRSNSPGNVVVIEVWPLVSVAGVVLNVDGTPASGISLLIDGNGPQNSSVREQTVTDGEGRYEFRVPPDHAYMIGVTNPAKAASSISGFVVPDEGTIVMEAMHLTSGTTFRGTVQSDGELNSSSLAVIERQAESQMFVINGQQEYLQSRATRAAGINAEGEFEILLGPGSYYAYYTGGDTFGPEFFEFEVTNQTEITHDFLIESVYTAELVGRVMREVDGSLEPMAGVTVTGVQINPQSYPDPAAVSDNDGRFVMNWQPGTMLLHAMSEDGAWGITHMLQGEPEELELVLLPTASAFGQMLGEGKPLAGFKFDCQIQVDLGSGSSTNRFGGKVETDDEGRFTIEHLIQGQRYWCSHHLGYSYYNVTEITAADATAIDLGQLEFDGDNRARTPVERMNDAFLTHLDVDRHFLIALDDARVQQQHVLVIVGHRDDAAVRNLFRLFFEEFDFWDERSQSPLRTRLHDFELCGIEVSDVLVSDGLPDEIQTAVGGDHPALIIVDTDRAILGNTVFECLHCR